MSKIQPYAPIRPPQKHVSHEQMLATLAKHSPNAKSSSPVPNNAPNAGETPKAELRRPLQWGKPIVTSPGSAHMYSACRRYRIDKIVSQTIVQYTVWRLCTVRGELNKRLGAVDEASVAQALAQADADAKATP